MLSEVEVEQYFSSVEAGGFASSWQCEVNLLSRDEANSLTHKFRGDPVIDLLNGLVLDDPNTSNHHVLLRHPTLAGQILYLDHDGDSRVVFASLQEFLAFAGRAQAEDLTLAELHPPTSPSAPNQPELAELIRALLDEEVIHIALMLIPSLDLSDQVLLADLIAHDDFFIGEAVANAILARPSQILAGLARQCAAHPHRQVARVGLLASEACGASSTSGRPYQ